MASHIEKLPGYLLVPEISALMRYVPDLHCKTLFTILWNIGGRITEAQALIRPGFILVPPYLYVQLILKQGGETAVRGSGRASSGVVPLSHPLHTVIATLRIPLERRPPRTKAPEAEKVRLGP